MGLLDKLKTWIAPDRLNVDARYELLREAVTGTMSSFYMARDRQTGEIVGLKLINLEVLDAFESRFKGLGKPSEGEIVSSLKHPRIVRVDSYGQTSKGQPYIVCEFLDGPVLSALLLTRDEILRGKATFLFRQMAEAVRAVHDAGFIHRDICARNFICSKDATSLKLIDFGLSVPMKPTFMQPGNRTGTPAYMAPEIVRRRPTDARVDIFALGVTAYQLCTFQLPWPSQDVTGKAALRHDTLPPEEILTVEPRLNKKLARLIMKCLSVDPDDRPASADALLRGLHGVSSDYEE